MKNAGFACFGSPSEILADIDAEGSDIALARVQERWLGLRELRAELGDAAIRFEPSGGHELYAVNDPLYMRVADRFDSLNADLRDVFHQNVFTWRDDRINDFGLATGHLAFTPFEGPLDSGALMRTLLAKVLGTGVEVRSDRSVLGIEEGGRQAVLKLPGGDTLRARQVIVATNGYTGQLLPGVDVVPARGQVLLTAPVPGLRLKGTFHAQEGYYYFREHLGAVLLGGGRHLDKEGETTTEDAVTPPIQEALESLLRETILPGHTWSIAQRWSGVMGFRRQGKSPLVERRSPNLVVAAGLSGMGVAIGIRVAAKAADLAAQD